MNEIKQGYKQTDIGVIPEDWEVKLVGEIYDLLCGFAFSGTDILNSGAHRLLRGINITEGEIRHNNDIDRFFNNDVSSLNKYFLEIDDLVIGMDGSKVGKNSALITQKDKGALLVQRVARLKSIGKKVSTSYLYLFINYLFFTKYVDGLKTNSAIPHISAKDIKSFLIPIPQTCTEQTAIATALSDVDNLIATLGKKITKKQQIKQGAMQQLLTGKKRLPGFSGRCKYKHTEFGLIPEDWEVKRADEIFRSLSTATYTRAELGTEGEIQCLHYGDIHSLFNEFVDFSYIELPKVIEKRVKNYSLLQDGDIVMADASEDYVGLCKSVEIKNIRNKKAISGLHTILLREKNSVYENGFKGYLFLIPEVRKQLIELATGMKVYGVSKKNLGQVLLPIPSKPEQITIAQILTDMANEISQLEGDRNKYERIKAGMMQQLLTGKIRLTGSGQTTIIPEQTKTVELNSKKQTHTGQINEAVVISFLVNKFSSVQYPLSRFRYTKFTYLLHRQYEHVACGFKKHAAGPYKPENRYKGPENIAIKNKYITKVENSKSGKDAFITNVNIAQALNYFNEWYGSEIQEWIEQFRFYKNDDLEVLTTVDESICDLNCKGADIFVTTIKNYIASIPQWKHKLTKSCFSDLNIERMIRKSNELFSQ